MLVLIEALEKIKPDRKLWITHGVRYKQVLQVLKQDGNKLYHASNLFFGATHLITIDGGAAVTGVAMIAAEATTTVTITVYAGSILGWFGAKKQKLSPSRRRAQQLRRL
jgi:hypothetical protein